MCVCVCVCVSDRKVSDGCGFGVRLNMLLISCFRTANGI